MVEKPANQAKLVAENRQLRATIESLLDELENGGVAQGHGKNPDNGPDTTTVRENLPAPPGQGDNADAGISPPWEREGYDSKQEWLAEEG